MDNRAQQQDMATDIDDLPLPPAIQKQMQQQQMQQQQMQQQQMQQQQAQQQKRVTFVEEPEEIELPEDSNITMEMKRKAESGENEANEKSDWKSLLNKKSLYEMVILIGMYVLLGQPFVGSKVSAALGVRFGTSLSMQLLVKGVLLAILFYAVKLLVLPKLT